MNCRNLIRWIKNIFDNIFKGWQITMRYDRPGIALPIGYFELSLRYLHQTEKEQNVVLNEICVPFQAKISFYIVHMSSKSAKEFRFSSNYLKLWIIIIDGDIAVSLVCKFVVYLRIFYFTCKSTEDLLANRKRMGQCEYGPSWSYCAWYALQS